MFIPTINAFLITYTELIALRTKVQPIMIINFLQLNAENRGLREGKANTSYDLNIEPAWIQGCTGKDIVLGIVDDGEMVN